MFPRTHRGHFYLEVCCQVSQDCLYFKYLYFYSGIGIGGINFSLKYFILNIYSLQNVVLKHCSSSLLNVLAPEVCEKQVYPWTLLSVPGVCQGHRNKDIRYCSRRTNAGQSGIRGTHPGSSSQHFLLLNKSINQIYKLKPRPQTDGQA